MGQTKKTGKGGGGKSKSKAPTPGAKQGGGGAQKKASKESAIAKGLDAQASSATGSVADPRAIAAAAVAEAEPELVVDDVAAELVAPTEGAETVETTAEGPTPGAKLTPEASSPVATPVVDASTPVAEDPISRAKAAATAKKMPARKVALITSTEIAEFILAQVHLPDPKFKELTPTQITTMTTELSPEQAKADAKKDALVAAKAKQSKLDEARVAAAARGVKRTEELAALVAAEATSAQEQCAAHGLVFSPTMRASLDTTLVMPAHELKDMADKTIATRQAELLGTWREKLRVDMINARYFQLRVAAPPAKGAPKGAPKGESLATLSKLTLKDLFDVALSTKGYTVAQFESDCDNALLTQRRPSIDKWVSHLGLKYNPESKSVGDHDGHRIHATAFQGTSFGPTLPTIGHDAPAAIITALFETGVTELKRVHVSMDQPVIEGLGFKNPHRYWGKTDAVLNYNVGSRSYARYDESKYTASAIDGALTTAMETLEGGIKTKVDEAVAKDGAI